MIKTLAFTLGLSAVALSYAPAFAASDISGISTENQMRMMTLTASAAEAMQNATDGGDPTVSGPDGFTERFGDWAVECRTKGTARSCMMGQYQENPDTGKTVVAIEISLKEDGVHKVVLLLPLGVNLNGGVQVKFDEQIVAEHAPYATCLDLGCLVPFEATTAAIEQLKHAQKLQLTPTVFMSNAAPSFNISLRGFEAAWQRLFTLNALAN
jgi:invasion protein IalB